LSEHKGTPEQIACVSIDMSQAFIKGVTKHLPNARVTFDKFHIVAHASKGRGPIPPQRAEDRS
jgi:transposase